MTSLLCLSHLPIANGHNELLQNPQHVQQHNVQVSEEDRSPT